MVAGDAMYLINASILQMYMSFITCPSTVIIFWHETDYILINNIKNKWSHNTACVLVKLDKFLQQQHFCLFLTVYQNSSLRKEKSHTFQTGN